MAITSAAFASGNVFSCYDTEADAIIFVHITEKNKAVVRLNYPKLERSIGVSAARFSQWGPKIIGGEKPVSVLSYQRRKRDGIVCLVRTDGASRLPGFYDCAACCLIDAEAGLFAVLDQRKNLSIYEWDRCVMRVEKVSRIESGLMPKSLCVIKDSAIFHVRFDRGKWKTVKAFSSEARLTGLVLGSSGQLAFTREGYLFSSEAGASARIIRLETCSDGRERAFGRLLQSESGGEYLSVNYDQKALKNVTMSLYEGDGKLVNESDPFVENVPASYDFTAWTKVGDKIATAFFVSSLGIVSQWNVSEKKVISWVALP
ncbi:MAG: hypothetical protein H0W78_18530 [Planctomycetes bacterium]|nr:hypothetical protein [Planctomycetota bacterium]